MGWVAVTLRATEPAVAGGVVYVGSINGNLYAFKPTAPSTTASAPSAGAVSRGSAVTDGATVTGDAAGGSPTGTISFSVCGPLASAEGCAAAGTAVGTAVTLSPGPNNTATATSAPFTPAQTGTYCFRATYSGDINYDPSSDVSAGECFGVYDRVVTGNVPGNVVIGSGQSVLVAGASVGGSISSNGAASLRVCGSTVGGSVNVSYSTGFVLIGDGGDDGAPGCAGNTIRGTTALSYNSNQVEVGGNSIGGALSVTYSSGPGPTAHNARSEIEANQIAGALSCSNNTPAPVNDGYPNAVRGTRSGQCSAPGF